MNLVDLHLRSFIYKILAAIISQFHSKLALEVKRTILTLAIQDLHYLAPVYSKVALNGNHGFDVSSELEVSTVFNNLLDELFQTINSIQHDIPINNDQFVQDLIVCAVLPNDKLEEYDLDLNAFVSDATGLNVNPTVRDSIYDLLTELNLAMLPLGSNPYPRISMTIIGEN